MVLYLLVVSFFWNICENFSAVADTFCEFKSLFLAYTNNILDQIYYKFFTFYRFDHVINVKFLCKIFAAVDQNYSTLSIDVCFNAKLQQLGKDLPPKTWTHIWWAEGLGSFDVFLVDASDQTCSCLNLINTPMIWLVKSEPDISLSFSDLPRYSVLQLKITLILLGLFSL